MAYSDYGGYAYRNGELVPDRSDFTIMPGGGVGTPGAYPGFAAIGAGASHEQVMEFISFPHHHAVIGNPPLMIGLHKQSGLHVYRVTSGQVMNVPLIGYAHPDTPQRLYHRSYAGVWYLDPLGLWSGHRWSGHNDEDRRQDLIVYNIEGYSLEAMWTEEDNFYLYARLEEPDGTNWCGFSGYGVGAGLETCGYGYSTEERVNRLIELWPDIMT